MGFTVVGEDGRRIERGVAHSHALEVARRIELQTGEKIQVVDDTDLEVDAVDRSADADPEVEPTPAKGRRK